MLLLHSFILSVLVRRRTALLTASLEREKKLAREAAEAGVRIESMQRAGAVSQMGSMLAHELKQPLAAIRYSARALMRMMEAPEGKARRISEAASVLHREAKRADEIVERVRNYARKQGGKQVIDLGAAARLAAENFAKSGRYRVPVSAGIPEEKIPVLANPLEAELAVLNLIKNAAEACSGARHPQISLSAGKSGAFGFIRVRDNGPRLSDEALKRLSEPLSSTKPDGLGLGLVIAASVAEAAGGKLSFERAAGGGDGLTAVLAMALQEDIP